MQYFAIYMQYFRFAILKFTKNQLTHSNCLLRLGRYSQLEFQTVLLCLGQVHHLDQFTDNMVKGR